MILTIAFFELQQRLRRISTWVYFLIFLGLGYLFVNLSAGAIPNATADFGTGGKVLVTSPYALLEIINFMALFGVVVMASLAGQATFQDIDSNCAQFFFTAPISKFQYLGGRFLGTLLLQTIIFSSIGLGAFAATKMPWLDATRLGPQHVSYYLQPYLIILLPNLVITSAIFFALATLGRRMLPVYAFSVLLLIGYLFASQFSGGPSTSVPSALIDPFGSNAVDRLTRYWTPFERNTNLVPLAGILLWNRVLWLGMGAAILAFTYFKFAFAYASGGGKRRLAAEPRAEELAGTGDALALPIAQQVFSASASFTEFFSLTRLQFSETVKSVIFLVLVFAGSLLAIASGLGINNPGDTNYWPVTWRILELASGGFFLFVLAIITYYSGELVWRERDAKLNQMMDSLPVDRWVLYGSKLAALFLVQVVLIFLVMVCGVVVQLIQNYHHFQFGLYARDLAARELPWYCFLCVLAFLVHTVINNKYLGHFVMVLYYLFTIIAMPLLGWQHYLYRLGETPNIFYSDIAGYGPYAKPAFWFRLYWSLGAVILAVLTNLLWVRGMETGWRQRGKLVAARWSKPAALVLAGSAAAMALTGGYIFYNTNVLNRYQPSYKFDEARAQYEKQYRKYKDVPQPRIVDIHADFDIYPEQRLAVVHGRLTLENHTSAVIDQVALTIWPGNINPIPMPHIEKQLAFAEGAVPTLEDAAHGFYLYRLNAPLPPQAQMALDFSLSYPNPGFVNSNPNGNIISNGSFLVDSYIPFIGYNIGTELIDNSTRHRHGLGDAPGLPKLEDVAAREHNAENIDRDWPTFEGTISTSEDQVALMPGYPQKEWVENGRRYFHYKADVPVMGGLLSANSARYAVRRDHWNNVKLEIYYQPGHEFNLGRMMHGMKATLDYCTHFYSPFQFNQERVIEFPRYGSFAESFPDTIPYSEAIGFITKVPDKPEAIDQSFFVTSHEVAHQWWGYQVVAANTEGQTAVVETLAQYTALMVMRRAYGAESMKRFLRFQLDGYLRGRATEHNQEEPLERVQSLQGYIHYNKGGMIMYTLADYIGEDKVNQALAAMVHDWAFKGPPFPTVLDLIQDLQAVTPPEYQYLITDDFENITLYDNRALSAKYTQLPDGKYRVQMEVQSKKYYADGNGHETPAPLHDFIDIGVLDKDGKYLYLQKHKIEQERTPVTVVVDALPAQAGIDPLIKLIDRNPDDNVIKVEKQ